MMRKWLNKLFGKRIQKSRKVTRAKFFYLYVIIGSIAGLSYFIAAIFLGLPKHWALSPLYLLGGFIVGRFLMKNWKLMLLYVSDVSQGKLLMFLNDNTHWNDEQKIKVINWVYLKRKTVRKETFAKISEKVRTNIAITDEEKSKYGYKSVFCPQQIQLGFNYALLIHALIYAHNNIQVLDDELRDLMELTDDHILCFDILKEREKAGGAEFDKYMEIGKRVSENLN